MKLVAPAFVLACFLVVQSCGSPNVNDGERPLLQAGQSASTSEVVGEIRLKVRLPDQQSVVAQSTDAYERAADAMNRGDKKAARIQTSAAINALLDEGRMNAGDQRIDVLARLSTLADKLGDMDLADQAWKRVCVLRKSTYMPEADHLRLMELDEIYRRNHTEAPLPPPPPPAPVVPIDPTGPDASNLTDDTTGKAVEAAVNKEQLKAEAKAEHELIRRQRLNALSGEVPTLLESHMRVAKMYEDSGDFDGAASVLNDAKDICAEHPDNDDPKMQAARAKIASKLRDGKKFDVAAELLRQAVESLKRTKSAEDEELAAARRLWADVLAKANRLAEAQAVLEQSLRDRTKGGVPPVDSTKQDQALLSGVVNDRSKELEKTDSTSTGDKLAKDLTNALSLLPPSDPTVIETKKRQAEYFHRTRQVEKALELRREIVSLIKNHSPDDKVQILEAMKKVRSILDFDLQDTTEIDREIEAFLSGK